MTYYDGILRYTKYGMMIMLWFVCMYACMHACMYVCMHACMYACMYVCMYVLWYTIIQCELVWTKHYEAVICDYVIYYMTRYDIIRDGLSIRTHRHFSNIRCPGLGFDMPIKHATNMWTSHCDYYTKLLCIHIYQLQTSKILSPVLICWYESAWRSPSTNIA